VNASHQERLLQVGRGQFDPLSGELSLDGRATKLRPRTAALLSHLVRHSDRAVGKDELMQAVWPDVVVTEDSLVQCVKEIRQALGDAGRDWIRTLPRQGYAFVGETAETGTGTPAASSPSSRWVGLGLAALVLAGGLAIMGSRIDLPVRLDEAIKARRSIAVMPFVAVGPDQREYFAESIAEDLVTELSRLPDTLVVARASAAVIGAREADVRTIGRELGVRHVLFGNVRRDGAAVQINARFVSAADGVVLWSDQFSYRDAAEWDWRRDIALRVARVLDVRLTAAARQPLRSGKQLDAIDAVLEGQHLLRYLIKPEDILRARALFEAALAVEPDSASALTGFAQSHLAELEFFPTPDVEAKAAQLALAEQAVTKALAVEPGYAYAYCLRGHALHQRGDFDGAQAVYQRYLAAYPSEAWAHARIGGMTRIGGMKLLLGRPQEVAAHAAAALKLSPLEHGLISYTQFRAGFADFHLGRDDAAYQRFRETAAARPTSVMAQLGMAAIDALQGRPGQAATHLAQARRLQPDLTISQWLQQSRGWRGDHLQAGTERMVEGLRLAGLGQ